MRYTPTDRAVLVEWSWLDLQVDREAGQALRVRRQQHSMLWVDECDCLVDDRRQRIVMAPAVRTLTLARNALPKKFQTWSWNAGQTVVS